MQRYWFKIFYTEYTRYDEDGLEIPWQCKNEFREFRLKSTSKERAIYMTFILLLGSAMLHYARSYRTIDRIEYYGVLNDE